MVVRSLKRDGLALDIRWGRFRRCGLRGETKAAFRFGQAAPETPTDFRPWRLATHRPADLLPRQCRATAIGCDRGAGFLSRRRIDNHAFESHAPAGRFPRNPALCIVHAFHMRLYARIAHRGDTRPEAQEDPDTCSVTRTSGGRGQ